MGTVDELETQYTLVAAVARFDDLRTREIIADEALTQAEALELLALGEVIARKAGYGRQLTVRTARQAGASWSQIGGALGTTKQAAWEAHQRWIDDQAKRPEPGHLGWDDDELAAARTLAGDA
ncbi:hypothetical protein [Actinomadura oligospora]|uniref:hypothetical protein n=1 Tax=Actinomadura oligospora TaxID=111804 RepID=UPI00047A390C|nr:hypothetical protein [Actinomadura oligospora]